MNCMLTVLHYPLECLLEVVNLIGYRLRLFCNVFGFDKNLFDLCIVYGLFSLGLSKAETQALCNYGSGEDENEVEEIEEFEAGPVEVQTSLQASMDNTSEHKQVCWQLHERASNLTWLRQMKYILIKTCCVFPRALPYKMKPPRKPNQT